MAAFSANFFQSGTFYLILWVLCGASYFIFRKKHKEEDEANRAKAREVNKEDLEKLEAFKNKFKLPGKRSE